MTPRVRSLMGIASTWILFQAGLALAAPVTPPEAAYVPGELIVKYRPSVEVAQRSALRGAVRAQLIRRLDLISAEHVRLAEGASMEAAIARLSGDPRVEYVQPNYRWHADVIPNDPRFPEQWSLLNTGQTAGTPGDDIHATQAWDAYTGDPNMKIGVIDSGVDYDHPDLAANIWTNPGEIPGNGLDDDDNGYVDDVHGYDVINDDGDPIDDNGHGTHVSGIIAGVGNNALGVAGVVWRAKLVTIKFLGADGFGSTAGAIASVQYAVTVGVRLTNNSWGGGAFDQALLDAINAAGQAGQLFVAAAGNNANDNDVNPLYPATYDTPYVLSVAATDQNDDLILLSNYGATTVDIAAPGQRILSCAPGGDYALRSGTSMAAPHASGAVAMAMGRLPGLTHLQIKQLLLYFADPRPQLAGKVLSGGRLNAFLPVAAPDSVHPSGIADLAVTDAGSNTLGLSWTAPGDDGMTGRVTSYEIRWSLTPLNPLNFSSATLVPGPDPLPGGSLESFEIGGLGFNATYYVGIRGLDEYFNAGPVSNFVSGTTLGIPNAEAGPASAGMVLAVGQNRDTVVTLSNTAAGTLDFTIPSPQVLFAQEGHPYQPHDKVLGDFRTGPPVVNGTGGPDGFGYRWSDSHQSGGPTFDWVDITATGTLLPLVGDDELSPPLPLGFDFPFYGNVFDSVRVCTNGFLTFTGTLAPFDNQPLPSAFAPPNLIAPLWDDLNFGITPRVYLQSDGTRAIVSWVGVPHHPDLGPYTFQVILFPSGEIRYQYLSIGIPSNSATVGIQNQSASAGLTVAFNATYLHDSLAVRLGRLQQWLSVTPASGRVPAGQSLPLQVHFDAASLLGGHYDGSFDVLSNDPDGSPLTVPAHLQVIGVPNVATNPATLDFGTVVIGDSVSRTLVLENVGSDTLFVTGFDCGDAAFAVADTAMTLGPLRNGVVAVKFHPTSPGPVQSSLEIASNDPDAPIFLVPLVGSVVTPPQILVGPDSQHVALATTLGPEALVSDRPLVIHNLGGAPLTWNLTTTSGLPLAQIADPGTGMARAAPPIRPFDELPKDDPGTPGPPVTATAGGPDLFGYRWVSSDDPGGPPFAWQEISTVGTEVVFDRDDQTLGPFPLPFTFNFYGVPYTSFRLCSNGWLSFTSGDTTYTNTTLPDPGAPGALLAPYWDDQDFTVGGQAFFHHDGSKFIVEFYKVFRYGSGGPYSYQIQLRPSGIVDFQYFDVEGERTNEATVGMQNADGSDGLQVAYNTAFVRDSLRVRFARVPQWLSLDQLSGVTPPNASDTVMVHVDATGLADGDYLGQVHVTSDDPGPAPDPVSWIVHVGVVSNASFNLDAVTGSAVPGPRWALGRVTLPSGLDPQQIVTGSVRAQGSAAPVPDAPVTYGANNATFRFNRFSALAGLPTGNSVPIEVSGQVDGATWFTGAGSMRMRKPGLAVDGTPPFAAGTTVLMAWFPTATRYDLWYSPDGGGRWNPVALGFTSSFYEWTVPDTATMQGVIELVGFDAQGYMGSAFYGPFEITAPVTGVDDSPPLAFGLRLAGANPVRSLARLELTLPEAARATARVYDVRGALVRTLADRVLEAGRHAILWDGRDASGHAVGAGVYFVRATAGDRRQSVRIALLD